jgi:hypothetical protein
MKTYTATIVSTQTQTVTVEVEDDISPEDLEAALCNAATPTDGEFECEVHDIEEEV